MELEYKYRNQKHNAAICQAKKIASGTWRKEIEQTLSKQANIFQNLKKQFDLKMQKQNSRQTKPQQKSYPCFSHWRNNIPLRCAKVFLYRQENFINSLKTMSVQEIYFTELSELQ